MENENEVQPDATVEEAMKEIVNESKGQTDQVALIATIAVNLLGQDNAASIVGPNSTELAKPYAQAAIGLLKASHSALVEEQQRAFDQIQEMVNKTNSDRAAERNAVERSVTDEAKATYDAMDAMNEEELTKVELPPEQPKQSAISRAMEDAAAKLSNFTEDAATDN